MKEEECGATELLKELKMLSKQYAKELRMVRDNQDGPFVLLGHVNISDFMALFAAVDKIKSLSRSISTKEEIVPQQVSNEADIRQEETTQVFNISDIAKRKKQS